MYKFTLVLCLLFPFAVFAQDPTPVDPELDKPVVDVRVHTFGDGQTFVCFTEDDSRRILQLRLQFNDIKAKLDKYEEWIAVKTKEITKLEEANGYLGDKVDAYRSENIMLKASIEDLDSWWRNPWVWFTVGTLVGAGGAIGIFYAVEKG